MYDETKKLATSVVSECDDTVEPTLTYFNFVQYRTLQDAGSIMGVNGLLNITIVTVHIYLHNSECLTVEGAEPTVGYNVLRNIRGPEAADHIHGSDT